MSLADLRHDLDDPPHHAPQPPAPVLKRTVGVSPPAHPIYPVSRDRARRPPSAAGDRENGKGTVQIAPRTSAARPAALLVHLVKRTGHHRTRTRQVLEKRLALPEEPDRFGAQTTQTFLLSPYHGMYYIIIPYQHARKTLPISRKSRNSSKGLRQAPGPVLQKPIQAAAIAPLARPRLSQPSLLSESQFPLSTRPCDHVSEGL